MNHHRISVRQRILFKVQVLNYRPYFLFYNARDLRSNNKLLIKPCQSIARIKEYGERPFQHAALMSGMNYPINYLGKPFFIYFKTRLKTYLNV